jgi:AcrR family transcriptional regulator
MAVKGRQAENSAATRAALIKIARKLFAEHGYADTATEEVVRRARVTRGALYHHFKDKKDLFKAVLLEEEKRLAESTALASAGESDPLNIMVKATDAFLDECLDPAVRQIVLIDAPAVLGWEQYRQIDDEHFLAGVVALFEEAIRSGAIPRQPVAPLARIMMGAVHEATMLIAHAPDQLKARREVSEVITRLLNGIRAGKR